MPDIHAQIAFVIFMQHMREKCRAGRRTGNYTFELHPLAHIVRRVHGTFPGRDFEPSDGNAEKPARADGLGTGDWRTGIFSLGARCA